MQAAREEKRREERRGEKRREGMDASLLLVVPPRAVASSVRRAGSSLAAGCANWSFAAASLATSLTREVLLVNPALRCVGNTAAAPAICQQ